jgi:N-acetyl sugar amidotransferase
MEKSPIKRCTECLLPQTHETISFDQDGVCSVCLNSRQKKKVDWEERKRELLNIVKDVKSLGKDYDCVIPFSGGKDSTFSLYFAVKELNLRPLVVSFDHGFYRDTLLENRNRTLKLLGVDFISFTPNWHLVKDLMLTSLRDRGDFCWHCHTGVNAFPVRTAVEKDIPLVIWGESSTEYTNYYKTEQFHEIDEELFNRITNLGISAEDMLVRLQGDHDVRALKPFMFPSQSQIKSMGIRSFPLGNYISWDTKLQVKIIKSELGWEGASVEGVPPGYEYEKIECMMQGMRDYLKFRKRGYARATHLASIDIRKGLISRSDGESLVQSFENRKPYSLELFLQLLGITEQELEDVIELNQIDPWEGKIPVQIGSKPSDYDSWVKKLIVR